MSDIFPVIDTKKQGRVESIILILANMSRGEKTKRIQGEIYEKYQKRRQINSIFFMVFSI